MLRCDGAGDNFAKRAQLLVCVKRLHRDEDVEACGARSFQETHNSQFFQLFMQRSRDGNDYREVRAVRRVEIEKEIVWVVEVVKATGPRIMIDATKSRQKQQGSAVARCRIMNLFPTFLQLDRNGLEPFGQTLWQILLKKRLSVDSVGIPPQNQCAVLEKRQNVIPHSIVVGQKVALRVTGLRKIHFVQVAEPQPLTVQFDGDRF